MTHRWCVQRFIVAEMSKTVDCVLFRKQTGISMISLTRGIAARNGVRHFVQNHSAKVRSKKFRKVKLEEAVNRKPVYTTDEWREVKTAILNCPNLRIIDSSVDAMILDSCADLPKAESYVDFLRGEGSSTNWAMKIHLMKLYRKEAIERRLSSEQQQTIFEL